MASRIVISHRLWFWTDERRSGSSRCPGLDRWIDYPRASREFPEADDEKRIRHASRYVYGEVSQTISWGAHAYLRGWGMRSEKEAELSAEDRMLGSYIQYGVHSPEAAVVSLMGIPRQFAEPFAAAYRDKNGQLLPDKSSTLRDFIENADNKLWSDVAARSRLATKLDPADIRYVWRQMHGKR